MGENRKIRVLVVDDSLLFREVLSMGISSDPAIEVVARAIDPFDARDKILAFEPDVMTCDVEMPKMNGVEFIRRLLPQYHLPTIVVSSVSEAVFDAMNAGAVDFVTKPNVNSPQSVKEFMRDLISKIKVAAQAKVAPEPLRLVSTEVLSGTVDRSKKIIAIGASTGGTEAIAHLLKSLPSNNMPGMVIVQHIPPAFSRMFADRLNNQTAFTVKEAQSGDIVESGKVLIAPGDQHMRIRRVADRYKVEVFPGDKINGHCPSVDVLFESVAKEAGNQAIGMILTGMGYDGARGLLTMRRKGARTLGQDERSAVVYGMPKVAFDIGAVEKQGALSNLPEMLLALLK
ncbi:protein-glutamate methylesterase/protein-glutamine glutaminase [Heliophilum fasciatum]|uniref:Protein-glutamate methylesterase/protein-glutamine glutaminase n=1 Tax=Heliophilum fasciatum TaxID=35700 RepID=A0A4R2RLM8_9FIRM|nr:chemotaxis response regulator protein-glutamate methylesterase [Heliophilum fasciatum]MCW2278328.1 two-component system chemotaxis response regulator CheB [Heliophilum fasciatum]TCP63798.1 two-component system chemotaxis response regulator CheB [Heliophilum fasciatum]